MSINRYAAKRDNAEQQIVEALELAGYHVERLSKPVDLCVRKHWYAKGVNMLFEVKTPRPNGRLPERKDRAAQNAFCDAGGAVKIGTPEDALRALHELELTLTP